MVKKAQERGLIIGCVVVLIILLVLTIVITGNTHSTKLENGLLQFIFFAISTGIALFLGYISAKEQAKEIIRPHGKKAVRRIVTLGTQIRSFGTVVQLEQERLSRQANSGGELDPFEVEKTLEVLSTQLDGQLLTINDAIEDWRDVVPDEVAALEEQSKGEANDG